MNWMNNNSNNFSLNNGMQQQMPMQRWNLPHYDAPLLNGKQDALNFMIGPNSSIWLPDANENIIWWIKTDSNGNKNVSAWDVSPHKDPEPVDLTALQERLANVEEWINAKSNKSNAKRTNTNNNVATSVEQSTTAG